MPAENKILSQREIDALLDASAAGTGANSSPTALRPLTKAVKAYDFRRPDKFSKDHMRTLQAMHQALARFASASLSSQMRAVVNIKMSSIDQGLYEEYIQQIQSPTILNIIAMKPLEGSIVIEYGMEIGMTIVDRMLGGPGLPIHQTHEVTDIEISLLRNAITPLLTGLAESWENLIELQPALQDTTLSPQFIQIARASDVVIVVLFEVQIGETVGGMSICLPFSTLETVMPRLNAQSWFSTPGHKHATPLDREDLRRHLMRTPVEMSARLGTTDLPTKDVLTMRVGDVIRLDRQATQDLEVLVVGHRMFRARPGLAGRKLAVRMTQVLGEEERTPDEMLVNPSRT